VSQHVAGEAGNRVAEVPFETLAVLVDPAELPAWEQAREIW
jgi:hypothetical protein